MTAQPQWPRSHHAPDPVSVPEQALQRTYGVLRVGWHERGLSSLYQEGAAKARFPRPATAGVGDMVLINTAGGLTGGDRFQQSVNVDGGHLVASTQAAEKLYRASAGVTRITTRARVATGATLEWLPQETILFDGARCHRALSVSLAPGARLVAAEATVLGRTAMRERVRRGAFFDDWRIWLGDRLVYADGTRLAADADMDLQDVLARPAVLGGADAFATLVAVTPGAERMVADLQALGPVEGAVMGASHLPAGPDGLVLARIVAHGGAALRRQMLAVLDLVRGGAAAPRMWGL
ncbi:urease accessory protein UreD [Yunchengibacter salinarum]|uniref:urease accessory protein UreD n=1 Tax=Yunchengibacter salinarum TaxID=3133399 RepID=UPI0035B5EA3A